MILHLTRDFPPRQSGGLSTAVGAIVAGLESAGAPTRVISFDGYGRKGGAKSDRLPRGQSSDRILRVRTKRDASDALPFALAAPPSLVHVHDPFLWPLAREVAAKAGAQTVHTLHVLSHIQDRLRGLASATKTTLAQKRAISEADALLAPSPAVAEALSADFPFARRRVRTVRLAVTGEGAPRGPDASGPIFVGRFSDLAGIGELVSIIEHLGPATPLKVVGGLPDNPRAADRWREALLAAGRRSGARPEMLGWLDRAGVARAVATASVLVAPNRFATFGLAVAEAMAMGVAVCAFEDGGLAHLIEDGRTGRLVPRSSPALAESVLERLRCPDETREMGARARAHMLATYSVELATEELLAAYGSIPR